MVESLKEWQKVTRSTKKINVLWSICKVWGPNFQQRARFYQRRSDIIGFIPFWVLPKLTRRKSGVSDVTPLILPSGYHHLWTRKLNFFKFWDPKSAKWSTFDSPSLCFQTWFFPLFGMLEPIDLWAPILYFLDEQLTEVWTIKVWAFKQAKFGV